MPPDTMEDKSGPTRRSPCDRLVPERSDPGALPGAVGGPDLPRLRDDPDRQRLDRRRPAGGGQGHPWVDFVEAGANLGFAAGNNLAARRAKGRWLVLLNPDAYAEPEWLAELMAGAERHPTVKSFASLQLSADEPGLLDGAGDNVTSAGIPFRGGYRRREPAVLPEGEVFSACGAAMLIDRQLFLEVGGFDERYFCYCEDVDLGYRLRLYGQPTLLLPKARVAHVGSASTGVRSDFAIFHGSRNRLWTFFKNTPGWLFPVTLPLHVAVTGGLLLLHWRRGDVARRSGASGRR
jgi:N-acetylglucosaminyl-diphospho-decaprenol L-rhamnosyltransferase